MKIALTLLLLMNVCFAQKKDTVFVLKGVKQNFQFLKFAIDNPRDITPNQHDAILKWLETIKPEDSIKVKK